MDATRIIEHELNLLIDELIQRHDQLKMRASGQWAESLEAVVEGKRGIIYGEPYTEQLVNGRPPGKFPPVKSIEKWIYDKGIQPINDNISISSLAFLIARKIAREGTEYFKQGGTDLISSVITPKRIQDIIDKVSEFYVSSFVSDVTNAFKKIAA